MLVLTRKQAEKIHIGDQIVVTVIKTKGNAVRLGIEAPAHVSIVRGEIAPQWRGDLRTAEVRPGAAPRRGRRTAGPAATGQFPGVDQGWTASADPGARDAQRIALEAQIWP
jgi:carbon storage regulator